MMRVIPEELGKWQSAFEQGLMNWDWVLWKSLLLSSSIVLVWVGLWYLLLVIAISPRTFSRWAGGYPVVRAQLVPAFMLGTWFVGILATSFLFLDGPIASFLYLNLNENVFFQLQDFSGRYLNLLGLLFNG